MSSTEIAVSPKKKSTKQKSEQISAVESFESESTVVKKSVKKSVKSSKTTTKKKTISTTESSSITSSKAESFENSFSNGSIEVVEQHHVEEHQAQHQESVTSSKSIDSSSGKELMIESTIQESSQDTQENKQLENGEKKKVVNGRKKSKRSKKSDSEKENISVKSSFSKFDALQKKNLQNLQNGRGEANGQNPELEKKCHACTKVVFQMEQIKAEKKFWHRNCFRCSECDKQIGLDTYQSHEGILFCKPHFKSLFAPKVVEGNNEPVKPRKLEMIIRENQPVELPPDVVRSSDKTDLGLEELQQLNVRQRFQVFENAGQQEAKVELDRSTSGVKRSTSILSKLARFQAKGMDVGVVDDNLNGVCYEHSSSEEEEEVFDDDENQEDIELIRAKRAQKEKPMSFKEMFDIKSRFENGHLMTKEERREERKQELQNIRSRLFLGKQAKIKEMYQQAVADSEQTITASSKKSDFDISDKAKYIKEKFEKGEAYEENDSRATLKDDEMSVFEQGIGKQSRSMFLELDATAAKSPSIQQSPSSATLNSNRQTPRQNSQTVVSSEDIVRSDTKVDDVQIENADIVSKFKFFETYKPNEKEKKKFRITPPREGVAAKLPSPDKEVYRDPHIARSELNADQEDTLEIAEQTHTASKMLSMFRQLEEHKEQRPVGPKPLKRFTPPPEEERRLNQNVDSGPEYSDDSGAEYSDDSGAESSEEELDPNYVKSSQKNVDEFLKAAQSAERANQLREKFEKWERNEIKKEMNNSSVNLCETPDEGQMETAKSLRARFEQMQQEEPKLPTATRIKVNRFV